MTNNLRKLIKGNLALTTVLLSTGMPLATTIIPANAASKVKSVPNPNQVIEVKKPYFQISQSNSIDALNRIVDFDGKKSIKSPNSGNLNVGKGDFTITAWVKTTTRSGIQVIVDKRVETSGPAKGYVLSNYNGTLLFQLADDSGWTNYESGVSIADGEWHHVAVTIDRDNPNGGVWYLDGKQVGKIFNPTPRQGSLDNSKPFVIGDRSDHPTWRGYFKGSIGYVRLWKSALSPSQISSVSQANPKPIDDNPNQNRDVDWYMEQVGLPKLSQIGKEEWVNACDVRVQQGAVTINPGRTETCTYQQDRPGWQIVEYKIDVLENKHGRGSYKGDIIAKNGQFTVNEQQIGDKWKAAIELAVKAKDFEIKRKLELEYQRHQQLIRRYASNKNTFFLKANANGGAFRKSVIHVKGKVRMIYVGG